MLQSVEKVSLKAPEQGAWLFVDVESFASYVYDILHKDPLKVPSQHEIDRAVKFLRHLFESFGYKFAAQSNGRRVTTGDVLFQLPWKNGRAEYEDRQNLFASLRNADKKLVEEYRNDPEPKQWRYIPELRSIRNSIQRNLPCPSINVYGDDATTIVMAYEHFHTDDDLPRFVLSSEVNMLHREKMRLIYLNSLDKVVIRDLLRLFDETEVDNFHDFGTIVQKSEDYALMTVMNVSSEEYRKVTNSEERSKTIVEKTSYLCGLRLNAAQYTNEKGVGPIVAYTLHEPDSKACSFCYDSDEDDDMEEHVPKQTDRSCGMSPNTAHYAKPWRYANMMQGLATSEKLVDKQYTADLTAPCVRYLRYPANLDGLIIALPPIARGVTPSECLGHLKYSGLLAPGLYGDTSYMLMGIRETGHLNVSTFHAFMKVRTRVLHRWLVESLSTSVAPKGTPFDLLGDRGLINIYVERRKGELQRVYNALGELLIGSRELTMHSTKEKIRQILIMERFKDLKKAILELSQTSYFAKNIYASRFMLLQALPPLFRRRIIVEMLWESAWESPFFEMHFSRHEFTQTQKYSLPKIFEKAHSFTNRIEFRRAKYLLFALCFMQLVRGYPAETDAKIPRAHVLCFLLTLLISTNKNYSELEESLPKTNTIHPAQHLYIKTVFEIFTDFLEEHETVWRSIENPLIPETPADMDSLDKMGLMVNISDDAMANIRCKRDFKQFVPNSLTSRDLHPKNYGMELPTRFSHTTSWQVYSALQLNQIRHFGHLEPMVYDYLQKYLYKLPQNIKNQAKAAQKDNPTHAVSKSELFTRDARKASYCVFYRMMILQIHHDAAVDNYCSWERANRSTYYDLSPEIISFLKDHPKLLGQFQGLFDDIDSATQELSWDYPTSEEIPNYSNHDCRYGLDSLWVPHCDTFIHTLDRNIPINLTDTLSQDEEDMSSISDSDWEDSEHDEAYAEDDLWGSVSDLPLLSPGKESTEDSNGTMVHESWDGYRAQSGAPIVLSNLVHQSYHPRVSGIGRAGIVQGFKYGCVNFSSQSGDHRPVIMQARDVVMQAIAKNTITLISANTGTGKSSLLPIYLYEQGNKSAIDGEFKIMPIPWQSSLPANIYCAVPTRVAAQSLAKYVAAKTHTKLGDLVGYRLEHGECCASANTRITYCTTGWLVTALFQFAELTQRDPESLQNNSDFSLFGVPVTHILIDDNHVLSAQVDLLLLLMKLLVTRYLTIRFQQIKKILESKPTSFVIAEWLGVIDWKVTDAILGSILPGKNMETIHDTYANRTRWVIMSATPEDHSIMKYLKWSLREYEEELMRALKDYDYFAKGPSLESLIESSIKLAISRSPKGSSIDDIAFHKERLYFDPALLNVLSTDAPMTVKISGDAHSVTVYNLDDFISRVPIGSALRQNIRALMDNLSKPRKVKNNLPVPDSIHSPNFTLTMKTVAQFCLQVVVNADIHAALVFVSGKEDIEYLIKEFTLMDKNIREYNENGKEYEEIPAFISKEYILIPLHGAFERADLQRAIDQDFPGRIKLYLATNIVESSITIEGLDTVVDLGQHFTTHYNSLQQRAIVERNWISKSSAIQRAGRVGRTRPGTVYRFYPRYYLSRFLQDSKQEVTKYPLSDLVLLVQSPKSRSAMLELAPENTLSSYESHILTQLMHFPKSTLVQRTLQQLFFQGALSSPFLDGVPTSFGESLSICPFDSASSRIMYLGHTLGCLPESIVIAAFLSIGDIFLRAKINTGSPDFLRSIRENTMGRVRAGTVCGSKGNMFQNLHSDLLSVLNVYVQLMLANENEKKALFSYYSINQKRFERSFCTTVKYFARVAMQTLNPKLSLMPLLQSSLSTSDVKDLFSFNIIKYRIFLFLVFYKDLAIRADTIPFELMLRTREASTVEKSTLLLIEEELHIGLKVGEKGNNPTLCGVSCDDSIEKIVRSPAALCSKEWKRNGAAANQDDIVGDSRSFFADLYLYALYCSNDKFFSHKTDSDLAPSGTKKPLEGHKAGVHNEHRFRVLPSHTWTALMNNASPNNGGATATPSDTADADALLKRYLDNVVSREIKCFPSHPSPSAFLSSRKNRLFGVGARTIDSGGDPNERRRADFLNVITGCEATLALYFFCFVTPLKMKFRGSSLEYDFYSNDSHILTADIEELDKDLCRIDEIKVTTIYYNVTLEPQGLKLGSFQRLLPHRQKLLDLIRNGNRNGKTSLVDDAIDCIQDILNAAVWSKG